MFNQDISISIQQIQYKTIGKLGEGQFGKVYKIVDSNGNFFALKEFNLTNLNLTEKQKKALLIENGIMEKINHPRILHLHDKILTSKKIGFVTTFCDGGDLESLLMKSTYINGFGEAISTKFLNEISEGFYILRKNRIIHRDLKLANIFLKKGHAVIGDFGFAKVGVSATGSKLGTPYYMAPEILFNQQQYYDARIDLWSIGVCYYLMIFGVLPFEANSMNELISKIESSSGDRLKFSKTQQISSACKNLLIKLLQKDPQKRMNFVEFFQVCGVQIPKNEENMLNAHQNVSEVQENGSDLKSSQLQDFKTQKEIEKIRQVKSNENNKQNQMQFSIDKSDDTHTDTPISLLTNIGLSGNTGEIEFCFDHFSKLTTIHSDSEIWFLYPISENDNYLSLGYFTEINKLVFNLRIIKHLSEIKNYKTIEKENGKINSTYSLLSIFLARKFEIVSSELKSIMISKKNVFELQNFEVFSASILFNELNMILDVFSNQNKIIYANLKSKFFNENPAHIKDFEAYLKLDINSIGSAINKLVALLIETFKSKQSVFNSDEKTFFLKLLLHLSYYTKIIPYPKFSKSAKEWIPFYQGLMNTSNEKIQSFLLGLNEK